MPQLFSKRFLATVLALAALLAGCANRPAQPVEAVVIRPVPVRIALVPVVDPLQMTMQNRGSAWGFLALPGMMVQRTIEANRADAIGQTLRSQSLYLGSELTAALNAELTRLGYEVHVIQDVKRPKGDPSGIEYESLETSADAIVSARISGAGMYAGQFSTNYVPRLNVDIEVVTKSDQSELHSHSIYYGADASKRTDDQIPADARFAYASFDQIVERPDDVVEGFRTGVRQIAALAAQQLHRVGRP